ncbi:MAG: YebC/PmpR family DNA-binding transcriptional regulator [Planctomycetota bacterium]|nr:MAG: YebC/PmpR family DNA-binding transcriptional regulator [Planctomycetota bacterium]
MAGHSHSSNIARRKSAVDEKRGKAFTKAAKDIIIAAREKGKDPDHNPHLRLAIEKAKAVNMPKDRIDHAILRGAGEVPGMTYEERSYEGYGPGGIAIIVDALTDSINRTAPEMKHLFSKYGGNMGEPGCVSYDFTKVGLILIKSENIDEDKLMEDSLEIGAEDFSNIDDFFEIITSFEDFFNILDGLKEKEYLIDFAEITKIPGNKIKLDVETGLKAYKLIDLLENQQDSQNVYTNLEYTDELIKAIDEI